MKEIIYPDESYKIMGACFEVYKRMGCGFLEGIYQECLEIEFAHRQIPYVAEANIRLEYRDRALKKEYRADFVCYEKILIEIKAVSQLIDDHRAQIQNYLNATGMQLGILVNFGHYPRLQYERFAMTRKR